MASARTSAGVEREETVTGAHFQLGLLQILVLEIDKVLDLFG
jgi:hypothetical protein